jgi:hypothetical protein
MTTGGISRAPQPGVALIGRLAARMAIEDFGGEVLGHKVELRTADHQNKPDLNRPCLHRVVFLDHEHDLAGLVGGDSGYANLNRSCHDCESPKIKRAS